MYCWSGSSACPSGQTRSGRNASNRPCWKRRNTPTRVTHRAASLPRSYWLGFIWVTACVHQAPGDSSAFCGKDFDRSWCNEWYPTPPHDAKGLKHSISSSPIFLLPLHFNLLRGPWCLETLALQQFGLDAQLCRNASGASQESRLVFPIKLYQDTTTCPTCRKRESHFPPFPRYGLLLLL